FDAVRDRPFLGWGPWNFLAANEAHLRPELRVFGEPETWADHAHSVPLDTMVTQGFLGFAVWLAAGSAVFLSVWRAAGAGRLTREAIARLAQPVPETGEALERALSAPTPHEDDIARILAAAVVSTESVPFARAAFNGLGRAVGHRTLDPRTVLARVRLADLD